MELSKADIFHLFFDETPAAFETINTSREDRDFRETWIVSATSGEKYVVKLADNDFTFPDKIKIWQRTTEEYRKLGYYCPVIFSDRSGAFPVVTYGGHNCTAYAEEYAPFTPAEDRATGQKAQDAVLYQSYQSDIWRMTARIAAQYLDYSPYPSGYCLFETFCASDPCDEVLENALAWKQYADSLPDAFREQVQRIWALWQDNRSKLENIYPQLPTSVFQADLNPTNILLDKDGKFVGIYDMNLCGRDVFLNYLMRENFDDFEPELRDIQNALAAAAGEYRFSELEKRAAPLIYRCLKPLWFNKLARLKEMKADGEAIRQYLNKTEEYLTKEIDFPAVMA